MATFLNNIPIVSKRKKSPGQITTSAKEALSVIISKKCIKDEHKLLNSVKNMTVTDSNIPSKLDPSSIDITVAENTIKKRLNYLKIVLYGDVNEHISTSSSIGSDIDESKILEISRHIQQSGLMFDLIANLNSIPFEARKDTALVFNNLIRKDICGFVDYCYLHRAFLIPAIISGYDNPEIALSCGSIAREILRYENMQRCILYPIIVNEVDPNGGSSDGDIMVKPDALIWRFFDKYIHLPNFDVASDAFNTLRELLVSTRNKSLVTEFLEECYDQVFASYELLLNSDNYVTRRRSLKMLGEILLDRGNFNIMIRYISSKSNLKTIMNLMRDKSPNIQFEAFHVFKVFVANPNKPPEITAILAKNKVKLVAYLESFHNDKDDVQFVDEKRLLIETLTRLEEVACSS